MKKTLLLLFILATLSALGQVRPPLEANTVRALTELDARKTIKFRTDSLDKAVMAYVEWNANCFRFKRLAAGSAWSSWICAPDEVTLDANAQDVFEIPSGKLTFKSTGKNMALRVDASNKYEFAGTIILNDDYTAFGKNAAMIGYDTVVYGSDTTYVPVYDNVYKNAILLGHNSRAFQDSTAFIGDSTIKQLWIAGSLNTKGILLEGDSAYMKHLVLQEADSGKIAKHMGKTIAWVDDDPDSLYFQGEWYVMGLDSISFADSIQINGQWVKFGESLTFPDSIQINGEWVHLGGSVTIAIPDAQTLSWNPTTGEITILGGNTIDIDGRYLTSETPQNLSWNPTTGALGIDGGTGVDLDGRYLIPPTATDGQIMIYGSGGWYAIAPIDERVSVIDSEGVKSAPALLSSEDFSVSQVGGAVDDWVVSVIDSYTTDLGTVYGSKGFDIQYNTGNYEYVYVDTLALSGSISNLINTGKYLVSTIDTTITLTLNASVVLGFDAVEQATMDIVVNGVSTELFTTSSDTYAGYSGVKDIDLNIGDSILFVASISHLSSTFNDTPVFSLTAKGSRITGEIVIPPTYLYNEAVGEWVSDSDTIKTNKDLLYAKLVVATDSLQVGSGVAIKRTGTMAEKDIWTGTQAEYDLIGTHDANTVYFINNGWWALAFLLLFSFSGFGQKWDAVKIGSMDIVRIYQGSNIIWEKDSEPTGYIILKTSLESDSWGPYFDEEYQAIVNTGATLHWEVTGAATYSVDTNLPVFDFSTPGEKVITITSSDNLTGLQYLDLNSNQLTTVDLTGLTGLQYLDLNSNQLTTVDLTGLTGLQYLDLNSNQLTTVDLTGLTGLQELYLGGNQLTSFDATGLINLQYIDLYDNQLTSFDATGLINLQYIDLYGNQLTSFDATGLAGLQYLDLYGNQLTSFDATGLAGLQYLDLGYNHLTSFDATGLTGLQSLFLYGNQLTSFDATGLTGLQELTIDNNQLTTTAINSMLDQLITIGNASGNTLDARNQVSGGCGDPAKIAALDAIWEDVFVDACAAPTFPEVTIGTQTWMSVNLDVDDGLGGIYAYDDNEANVATYGRLYTWDAAMRVAASIDGWHLPSDAEWTTLRDYLGGESVAGGKLKEAGTAHWNSPNTGATNETGFTALPGGFRYYDGKFYYIGNHCNWWSATKKGPNSIWYWYVYYNDSNMRSPSHNKENGYSVRLIKDTP